MELQLESANPEDYLASSDIIDFDDEAIARRAAELARDATDELEIVRAVFEFVRDGIAHSFDGNGAVVTVTASQVLKHGEGICYAKAHLFAAILRALGIPTGICYQRLTTKTDPSREFLHALNAVYFTSLDRWVRLDPRGNKEGVSSEFSVDDEKVAVAFPPGEGVVDFPTVYVAPNRNVLDALRDSADLVELNANLPCEL